MIPFGRAWFKRNARHVRAALGLVFGVVRDHLRDHHPDRFPLPRRSA